MEPNVFELIMNKMDDMHDDIKETRDQAKLTNGRLRKAEEDIILLKAQADARKTACGLKFNEIEPTIATVKTLNFITKNPKWTVTILVAVLLILQSAVDGRWLSKLVELF